MHPSLSKINFSNMSSRIVFGHTQKNFMTDHKSLNLKFIIHNILIGSKYHTFYNNKYSNTLSFIYNSFIFHIQVISKHFNYNIIYYSPNRQDFSKIFLIRKSFPSAIHRFLRIQNCFPSM